MKNKVSKIRYSICIATYNRAEFLFDAIRSAINQVFKNFEVIIVNDGSTDNTRDIAASFISENVHYFEKPHSGAPETRNMAVENAKGEFIVWLGDDDILLPGTLSFYEIYSGKYRDADILYCYLKAFSDDPRKDRLITPKDWYNDQSGALGHLVSGSPITDGGCAVKRKVYDKIGLYNPDFRRAQDYEFWSRVIPDGTFKYKLVDKVLYLYRLHEHNITGKADPGGIDFSFETKIINNLLENNSLEVLFPKLDWTGNRQGALLEAYYFLALKFLYIKQVNEGIRFLTKINEIEPLDEKNTESLIAFAKTNYDEKTSSEINRLLARNMPGAGSGKAGSETIISEFTEVQQKINLEKYDEALSVLRNLLCKYEDSDLKKSIDLQKALSLAGNLSLLLEDIASAHDYFERELQNYPSSADACLGLGKVFMLSDDMQSAKTMLEWAVKNNPDSSEAADYLFKVNHSLGLSEKDGFAKDNMNVLDDNDQIALITKAEKLLSENRLEEAEVMLVLLRKSDPGNLSVLNDLAVLEILRGNYVQALQYINEVVDIDPENIQAAENVKYVNEILNSGRPQ